MEPQFVEVTNIRQLRIGDIVRVKGNEFEMYVVAVFADAGTLGFQPADHTGMVYTDFEDNQGDVFEYDLANIALEVQVTGRENIDE